MPKTKTDPVQYAEAVEKLKSWCPQGSRVYGVVRKVSSSGMSRRISFYVIKNNELIFLDGYIAHLGDFKRSPRDKGEGLIVGGCGMNMIMHVVTTTAERLYGRGDALSYETL